MRKKAFLLVFGTMLCLVAGCGKEDAASVNENNLSLEEQYAQARATLAERGEDVHSLLKTFPDTLDHVETVDAVSFAEKEGMFDATYEMFLLCTYDEAEFAEEQTRLAELECVYGEESQSILYDADSFAYPAYIAIYTESEIEYAVVDSEKMQIGYVFLQLEELEESQVPEAYQISYEGDAVDMYLFDAGNGVKEMGE